MLLGKVFLSLSPSTFLCFDDFPSNISCLQWGCYDPHGLCNYGGPKLPMLFEKRINISLNYNMNFVT